MNDKSNFDVGNYWEQRYKSGRTSGAGSYNRLANYKSKVLTRFLENYNIASAVELGCGDGAQLGLIDYPQYLGLDISKTAIEICEKRFVGRSNVSFMHYIPEKFDVLKNSGFDLALSLDVIYHLSNDETYNKYLEHLFAISSKFVIIYSNSQEFYTKGVNENAEYVRFRDFISDIRIRFPEWGLIKIEANYYPFNLSLAEETSIADFYIFKKNALEEDRTLPLENSELSFLIKKAIQKQIMAEEQTQLVLNELNKVSSKLTEVQSQLTELNKRSISSTERHNSTSVKSALKDKINFKLDN